MDFFHICYLLSQACLGELNQNFRRIYFSLNSNEITLYFILEKFNEEDQEAIQEEIISEFSILIENFLGASGLEDNYIINSKVILNDENDFFLKKDEKLEYFEEFYRRKE
ncbi:hypothetical protein [Psychrobacter sp. ENNN9_III]|uniref:hypothetical protein n=1 Tax=Psychrobacter sp. ENNN9_III TaxID=1254334 RepID=UPI00071E7F1C|nr:hypothetical protein [Psychrobacter sp. ENNN9_III]